MMKALLSLALTLALLFAADVGASFAGGRRDPRRRSRAAGATAMRSGSGLPARAGPPDDDRLLDDRARPDILAIRSEDEYADFLGSKADGRICVIKFYASWCKSCAKFGVKYRRLARDRGDVVVSDEVVRAGEARFAEVEYTSNARLCKSLRVKRLPSVHFHVRGRGKVSEVVTRPSQFDMVERELERLLGKYGREEGGADFDGEMEEGSDLVDGLMDRMRSGSAEAKLDRT